MQTQNYTVNVKKIKIKKKILALTITVLLVLSIFLGLLHFPLARADLSYTVSKSGSYTIVSLGGSTVYNSSSATSAFSYVFGQVASGGTVTVNSGTYTASGAITMQNVANVNLIFNSGAILTIPDSAGYSVFSVTNCQYCNITGGSFDGNKAGQSTAWTTDGIILYNCVGVSISNVNITNCYRDGYASYHDTEPSIANGIRNSVITSCGWNGLTLGENKSYAINNEVAYCSDVGITCYGYSNIVTGNYIHDMNGTTNTQAHWAIGCEGNGYDLIKNNIIVNCGVGVCVSPDAGKGPYDTKNNLITNNTITNTLTGIATSGAGFDTIINNNITNWGTNWNFGIRTDSQSNEIIAFNILKSISTDTALGYPINLYNTTNCAVFNNTITTSLTANVNAIFLQLTNRTTIQGNNLQAGLGINIYQSTCYNNRIIQNTWGNCSSPYSDTGTNTLIPSSGTSGTETVLFHDNFNDGTYNAWTGHGSYNGGPWIVSTPTFNGSSHSAMMRYSYDYAYKTFTAQATVNATVYVRRTADLAPGETVELFQLGFSGGDSVIVSLRNNGGTMQWGMSWPDGSTSHSNYTTADGVNNWSGLTIAFSKGSFLRLYNNGTLLFDESNIQPYYDANTLRLQIIDSSTSYPQIFFGDARVYYGSSGTGGVNQTDAMLYLNQNSLNGVVSPVSGRYNYSLGASQTITLTPSTYYSGILNVNGGNVSLSSNQYSLSMNNDAFAFGVFEQSSPEPTPTPTVTPTPTPTPYQGGGGGGGGGGSSEKFTVNIKIIKDSEPLPSVLVKLSSTKMPNQYENTNINGIAAFKLKSGIYDVQVFTDNTLAENLFNGTITVSRAETFTENLHTQTITPAATPTPSPFEITA
jgi:hypothetical protein